MRLFLAVLIIVNFAVVIDTFDLTLPTFDLTLPTFDIARFIRTTFRKAEDTVADILSRCYGDYGCFSIGGNFHSPSRPINVFPSTGVSTGTKLMLFTRNNPKTPDILVPNDVSGLNSTNFDLSIPTKLITHGFLESGQTPWLNQMKDEFIIYDNYNVIIVDWGSGSIPPYTMATANIRLVGAMVAKFFQLLLKTYNYRPEIVHFIGHSLGAHLGGYVGQRIGSHGPRGPHLGRISGLDPAGPFFENTDPEVRLDPTDAIFVDIIHTDASSLLTKAFGMVQSVGHVDFFPNGGTKQPGCKDDIDSALISERLDLVKGVTHWAACHHYRSHQYFTESINSPCLFQAYECTSYANFKAGLCTGPCGNYTRCARMGFHAFSNIFKSDLKPINMFLMTRSTKPFCSTHYLIRIHIKVNRSTSLLLNGFKNSLKERTLSVKLDGREQHTLRIPFKLNASNQNDYGIYHGVINYNNFQNVNKLQVETSSTSRSILKNNIGRLLPDSVSLEVIRAEIQQLETRQIAVFCNKRTKYLASTSPLMLYRYADCS